MRREACRAPTSAGKALDSFYPRRSVCVFDLHGQQWDLVGFSTGDRDAFAVDIARPGAIGAASHFGVMPG